MEGVLTSLDMEAWEGDWNLRFRARLAGGMYGTRVGGVEEGVGAEGFRGEGLLLDEGLVPVDGEGEVEIEREANASSRSVGWEAQNCM